ncbi:Eukaryotic translation initiation factor 3 subunit H [Sparassis crispa]|uniref:Eukaryotic translation initiation factor 3 subunit H n=1 Tax=Sparassis crispa TaxID=139825 RepID=A0A401G7T2_9APHY|nr:Eukaryotic translation initiation factor 3 subunit H [Sparassis crispa]GBE78208.1 Eukaryotic translation initiation factor 3 subunit H [Sparassis crispa]
MAAVTSMAAALAASLPAPQAAPAPFAPTYEAIPASMSKAIDIEAEIPLQSVQLDGMAVSKIVKHSREAQGSTAHGLLLGLDFDGTLEISNSFPLPHHATDDDDKSAKGVARYQAAMLRSLKEVQADDSVVGFYQAMALGSFFSQNLVETQAFHQDKLRHGGIVIVHDVTQTARGNASFRAFRLTKAFLDAYKRNNFSTARWGTRKNTRDLEVPLKIRTNALLSSFLGALSESTVSPVMGAKPSAASSSAALPPSFSALNLGTSSVARNLEHIVDAVDNYRTEEGNLAYLQRQITREKARAEAYVSKRKEENATRVAQGLAPLPEEDVSRLFKIPVEPSRLESLLVLGKIDAYAKSLAETSSTGLVKMYAAKANSG